MNISDIINDNVNKNSCEQISLIQQEIDKQVKEVTTVPDSEGHVYPVTLVKSWTNELKSYNTVLSGYVEMLQQVNLDKIDRTWLQKQVLKFINWLKDKLAKMREKIISSLKAMMSKAKDFIALIDPIVNFSISLDAIVSWAKNVVSFFMKPYMTVIQFIQDFATYTPPLVSEAAKLATTVATVPGEITSKINQLEGEGAEIIKEEIANAVAGIAFEPPSMGDLS